MIDIDLGTYIEKGIEWMTKNMSGFFDAMNNGLEGLIFGLETALLWPSLWVVIGILTLLSWWLAGRSVALFTLLGTLLIGGMGLWEETMQTLALVFSSSIITLLIGIPVGIWAGRNDVTERVIRPILDLMQTLPAFVYLIPAVLFFKLGKVPGVVATIIFSMPPAVRLTNLGIRGVSAETVEAAKAFGASARQILFKVQLPLAVSSIMAGINQTIMLSLSMVVIAAMIGAGGLGASVLKGITQLKIGLGFESGIAVVILAIILDRITQGLIKQRP